MVKKSRKKNDPEKNSNPLKWWETPKLPALSEIAILQGMEELMVKGGVPGIGREWSSYSKDWARVLKSLGGEPKFN